VDDLIKLVRTYRFTAGLTERLQLTEIIIPRIAPDLAVFLNRGLPADIAQDALQEVLLAIAVSLQKFQGDTEKEFWGWCYRIARNKLNDQYRKQASDRLLPTSPEELWDIMELSAVDAPMTAQTRHDLKYVIDLLTAAKPGCSELLWRHYVVGLDYAEIALETALNYDAVRMKIGRCLDEAKSLVS
jgi:RNA polymerase sigma factor (sigma-70 family)